MALITSTTSKRFTLKLNDFYKGLLMAVLVPVVTIITNSINLGELTFNWKQIWITAIGGFLGYLTKNLFSPSQIVITDPAAVKSIKDGESQVKVVDMPFDNKMGVTGMVSDVSKSKP